MACVGVWMYVHVTRTLHKTHSSKEINTLELACQVPIFDELTEGYMGMSLDLFKMLHHGNFILMYRVCANTGFLN